MIKSFARRLELRRHYTTGLIIFLIGLFGLLYLLIDPLSAIDEHLVSLVPLVAPGLYTIMVVLSALGEPAAMIALAIGWAGIEWAWGRRDRALVMLASVASAPVFYALKLLIQRVRPASEYVMQLQLNSYSFPSGHATMSFAILLTLAYLLSLRIRKLWSWVITTGLVLLVVGIGFSRVYLQVHYPTDVVGGWIIGAIVLLLVRGYVSAYERRTGKVVRV